MIHLPTIKTVELARLHQNDAEHAAWSSLELPTKNALHRLDRKR